MMFHSDEVFHRWIIPQVLCLYQFVWINDPCFITIPAAQVQVTGLSWLLVLLFLDENICCGVHWKRLIETLSMHPTTNVLKKKLENFRQF